jgi:hypothetical protein
MQTAHKTRQGHHTVYKSSIFYMYETQVAEVCSYLHTGHLSLCAYMNPEISEWVFVKFDILDFYY